MHATPPGWNAAEPEASLLAYGRWLLEAARLTFLADATHAELFFLFTPAGLAGVQPVPAGTERESVLPAVREAVQRHGLTGVLHVAEAWACLPKGPEDAAWRAVMQGESRVSELPEAERAECLLVRLESAAGASRLWMNEIIRGPNGVALSDPIEINAPPRGRFGSFFSTTPD